MKMALETVHASFAALFDLLQGGTVPGLAVTLIASPPASSTVSASLEPNSPKTGTETLVARSDQVPDGSLYAPGA